MNLADVLEFGNSDDFEDEIGAFLDDEEEEAMGGSGMASLATLVDQARGGKPSLSKVSTTQVSRVQTASKVAARADYIEEASKLGGGGSADLATVDGLLRERGYLIDGIEALWSADGSSASVRDQFLSAIVDLLRSSQVDALWREKQLETFARLQSDAQQQERTVVRYYHFSNGGRAFPPF